MVPSARLSPERVVRDPRLFPEGEAGVSLVALLVVVLILGVLAVLAATSIDSGSGSGTGGGSGSGASRAANPTTPVAVASAAVCEASAKAIEAAAVGYYAGHDETWPPDIATLTGGDPPLLRSAPDPKWGLVYDPATGTVDASGCNR